MNIFSRLFTLPKKQRDGLNKTKAALMVAKGSALAVLPYLPQAAALLNQMHVDPRAASVVSAAAMIFKAFRVDPATGHKPMPQNTDDVAASMPQSLDVAPQNTEDAGAN